MHTPPGSPSSRPFSDAVSIDDAMHSVGFGPFQQRLSLACGLAYVSAMAEVTAMVFLEIDGSIAKEFGVGHSTRPLLSSALFCGMLFGSPFWGRFADRNGRRAAVTNSTLMLVISGVCSALSWSFSTLLFARMLVGFAMSGTHVFLSLYTEFLPIAGRGTKIIMMQGFWSLGAAYEIVLARTVLGDKGHEGHSAFGWRTLLALTSLPAVCLILLLPLLPESPRFLIIKSRFIDAQFVLARVARINKRILPRGLLLEKQGSSQGNFSELLSPQLFTTSCLLFALWFSLLFAYYGIILISHRFTPVSGNAGRIDFLGFFVETIFEVPCLALAMVLFHFLTRKRALIVLLVISCLSVGLLFSYSHGVSPAAMVLFLTVARGTVWASYSTVWVITAEIFPTTIRSSGMGVCSSVSRFSSIITPFIANLRLTESIMVYFSIILIALITASFLHADTDNIALRDTMSDIHGEELGDDQDEPILLSPTANREIDYEGL